ncbi:unnamed protein product [Dovyalis caffra]|uniref:Uncharacterized protein n=1 Tax=Dovyalis caffra TaxID=77055 RepID=A0AAV1SP30_9ROSI|nr:unnamed protein product [Dovyalis caffra]
MGSDLLKMRVAECVCQSALIRSNNVAYLFVDPTTVVCRGVRRVATRGAWFKVVFHRDIFVSISVINLVKDEKHIIAGELSRNLIKTPISPLISKAWDGVWMSHATREVEILVWMSLMERISMDNLLAQRNTISSNQTSARYVTILTSLWVIIGADGAVRNGQGGLLYLFSFPVGLMESNRAEFGASNGLPNVMPGHGSSGLKSILSC